MLSLKKYHRPCSEIGYKSFSLSQIAYQGVMIFILAWPRTFLGIDHEIFSMVILLLPLIQEKLLSVQKYVNEVLVNC